MSTFITLATFEYSTEAHLIKTKLDYEGIRTRLLDEKTIDSDPLISQAIGGVKLQVHNEDAQKTLEIYNEIRKYQTGINGNDIHCKQCNSMRILVAPAERKNFFYMLFPFFEKTKYICNDCKTIF